MRALRQAFFLSWFNVAPDDIYVDFEENHCLPREDSNTKAVQKRYSLNYSELVVPEENHKFETSIELNDEKVKIEGEVITIYVN